MRFPEGATNWSLYDVPTIAAMLDEHYDEAWDQVLAWRYAYDTISEHRAQLSRARTELAAGWPPDQSIASERYFETIDGLDRSLADTSDAAIRNSNALADVLTALSQAKASIDWLNQSWKTNATAPATSKQGRGPIRPTTNAVSMADLNTQAHEIMIKTDQVIFENTRQLTSPPPYRISITTDDFTHLNSGTGSDAAKTKRRSKATGSPGISAGSTKKSDIPTQGTEQQTGSNVSRQSSSPISKSDPENALIDVSTVGTGGATAGTLVNWLGRNSVDPSSTKNIDRNSVPRSSTNPSTRRSMPLDADESQSQPGGMLSPGMGIQPQSSDSSRRRRRRSTDKWTMPTGVPSLLVPHPEEPIYHDPGPGVIGLTK